jgi:hypothetical protein
MINKQNTQVTWITIGTIGYNILLFWAVKSGQIEIVNKRDIDIGRRYFNIGHKAEYQ